MYDILDYVHMIADGVRVDAYADALRKVVKPGALVADIGTGIGVFALLACQFGARFVYAIEPNDAINVAREIAAQNGHEHQIEFIQALSTKVTIPERADVIVSDLRGVLPFFRHHLPSIIDARKRFLAMGGVIVPRSDSLWAAVVQAPEFYRDHASELNNNYGLDLRAARRLTTNRWSKVWATPEHLLSKPGCWAVLEYLVIENFGVDSKFTLEISRGGMAHGFTVWFDTTLVEGVTLSNAPGNSALGYANAFFPWTEPVEVAAGDEVEISIRATLVGEDYVWNWMTRILSRERKGCVKKQFSQSTFHGAPLSACQLRKLAADYLPELNEDGEITRLALELMGDGLSLKEIALRIAAEFPSRFKDWQQALDHIGDLSRRYS